MMRILSKLGATDRTFAVIAALRHGIVHLDE
jgi:DNA-binding NarL/FixJ family response regulator